MIKIFATLSCLLVLNGCVTIYSHSLDVSSKINSRFVIAKDTYYSMNNGLWYLEIDSKPDSSYNWEGEKRYSFLYKNPTGFKSDSRFIILKKNSPSNHVRYMIVEIKNDKLVRGYRVKNEKKYIELRKKLNVPDSLKFSD